MEVFFLMMGLWLVVAVALGLRRPRGLGGAALRARLDAVYGEPHELVRISPVAQAIFSYRSSDSGDAADSDNSGYARLLLAP